MLIRLIVGNAVRILRASNAQGARFMRRARKHGMTGVRAFADWESGIALAQCADGYDAACNTMPARYVPADESAAKAREVAGLADDTDAVFASLVG